MDTTHEISTLCVGGEWACAHGDVAGLREVVTRLAAVVPPPLRDELRAVAEACRHDAEHAAALWVEAERRVISGGDSRA